MKKNLIVNAQVSSALRTTLEQHYSSSKTLILSDPERVHQANSANLLFIDEAQNDVSSILTHPDTKNALEHGIPIVIHQPSVTLQTKLAGLGIEGIEAIILIKGKGNYYYSQTFANTTETHSRVVTKFIKSSEDQQEVLQEDHSVEPVPIAVEKVDIPKAVLEALNELEEVEQQLKHLANKTINSASIPQNRKWSYYWDMKSWEKIKLSDPSEEQSKTQTARFRFTVTFSLLAANEPVKKKVFNASVGGTGFEPFMSDQSMIRNDHKHRGWAQTKTAVKFAPSDDVFGNIESYQPINSANDVTITTGYSWDIGFEAGGGPEGPQGSVSFSYSQNQASSINTKDFETLTESLEKSGIRFYHNCHVVGGDTTIDARNLFTDETWNSTLNKLFYYHFPDGYRVRSWPSLARTLLQAGAECVWYAESDETRIGTMCIGGLQGLTYAYFKKGYKKVRGYENSFSRTIKIDFSNVNYYDQ